MTHRGTVFLAAAFTALIAAGAFAQTPPDDKPSIKVGATIFAQYTYQQSPETTDAQGDTIHLNSFDVTRSYINIIGQLNHIFGFRITPDISRETGTGSSLNGSYVFRLKYAFAQMNLDQWTTKGTYLRFGLQQTPWIDYAEGVYRYRFQGPTFVDKEGYLTSSDFGFAGHYNFPSNYGDLQAGFYNGEGYNHQEPNNQKSFQIRATVRPVPTQPIAKGLRITGFADLDNYQQSAKKTRYMGQVSFESHWFNAAVEYLQAKDQTSMVKPTISASGYSVWATPKFGGGWEALLRHDEIKPDKTTTLKRKHDIAGIAYWFPHMVGVQTALMLDWDQYKQTGVTPAPPKTTLYGIKMLVNF